MEHIVQFGINLDDEAISQAIVNQAGEEVRKAINKLRGEGYYGRDEVKKLVEVEAGLQIKTFIRAHSEEIIARAAKDVASSIVRTKAFREAAGTLADEIREGRQNNE
jgi:hypothetical protein